MKTKNPGGFGSILLLFLLLACPAAHATTFTYATEFEFDLTGTLSLYPGDPLQDSWYHLGLTGGAEAEITAEGGYTGQCLALFQPAANPDGSQSQAVRDFEVIDLTRKPLVSLQCRFRCESSDLTSINRYWGQIEIQDSTHPGYVVLAPALVAGENGVPRDQTGLDLVLTSFVGGIGNLPIALTVGQDLTWDIYHDLDIRIDHASGTYLSVTVDGVTQDLTGQALPRTFVDGAWYRGAHADKVSTRVVAQAWGEPAVRTDDWLRLDDLSVSIMASEAPLILDVADVGNDNGRQIRLSWVGSRYDSAEGPPVYSYDVYRRQDVDKLEGWDYVLSVPAAGDEAYQCLVPTLGDSTGGGPYWSVFLLRAMTADPLIFFTSAPDSGYSVDNLVPEVPGSFDVTYGPDGVDLQWAASPSPDFHFFRLYRHPANRLDEILVETTATSWFDATGTLDHRYSLAVVDQAGNESAALNPTFLSDVPPATGLQVGLAAPVPNPFNPRTRLDITASGPVQVTLDIYDLAGRHVCNLMTGRIAAGRTPVFWDGRNGRGQRVPAAVYWARLKAGDHTWNHKLVLVN